jgi:hypothetical protein
MTAILASRARTPRADFQFADHKRSYSPNENHRDLIVTLHFEFRTPNCHHFTRTQSVPLRPECADLERSEKKVLENGTSESSWVARYTVNPFRIELSHEKAQEGTKMKNDSCVF